MRIAEYVVFEVYISQSPIRHHPVPQILIFPLMSISCLGWKTSTLRIKPGSIEEICNYKMCNPKRMPKKLCPPGISMKVASSIIVLEFVSSPCVFLSC